MQPIYTQLRDILRNEYVDIEVTKSKLEDLKEKAQEAGPQFEHFRQACLSNLKHQHAIAIDYANRALKIAETQNDRFLLEHIHALLGFIAYNRGDFEKCIEHYLYTLQQAQSPRILNNIGAIFDDFNDVHEAYRYYRQAEEVFDDPLNFRLLAIIYCNIAECETAFGHYTEAKRYLELSQKQIQQFTHKEGTAYIFNALGDLAYAQGDYDTAISHYSKGESFARDESILVYYRNFILNHAKALFAKGDLEGAKSRIELLFEDSSIYNFDSNLPEIQELLAKIADAKGQVEIANTHYKNYIDLMRKQEAASLQHRSESIKISIRMSELHTQLNTLNKLSRSDALTGLGNRFALREYIKTWMINKKNRQAVIALLDVDHFKMLNDTYGHSHGDTCLSEVAKLLKAHFPTESGSVFRYGGDEFLITLIGFDSDEALHQLERTRQAIETLNTLLVVPDCVSPATISCSIGAVTVPANNDQSFEDLFDIADRALYISKDQGRNRVTILSSK